MKRASILTGIAVTVLGLLVPAAAQADFGIVPGSGSINALNSDGTIDSRAGSHPAGFVVQFKLNADEKGFTEGGRMRNVVVSLPPGLVGNPQVIPACSRTDFDTSVPQCPPDTQVGVLNATGEGLGEAKGPIYNLVPPPGVATQLGFSVIELTSLQNASVLTESGYGLGISAINAPIELNSIKETIWGVPAASYNDARRGQAASEENGPPVASTAPERAYLSLPASCDEAPKARIEVDSVEDPPVYTGETVEARNGEQPQPMTGCNAVPFSPGISSQATTKLASSPSGLDFSLKLPNQGLTNPGGIAETEPRHTVVTLPEGLTVNPSLAEGVGTCSPAQYKAEQIDSNPGEGCPEAAKIGSVIVQTPLLEEPLEGSVFLSTPYENPSNSLVALYLVARAPERGILVKQAGGVAFNEKTGQVTADFPNLPPLPYSSFKLHFREGGRSPLATPQACGEYRTVGRFTPFSAQSDAEAVEASASLQIEHGADGGACPSGGTPSFHPGLVAGSINAAAGKYSPFNVRISRTDSEQEITHFSIKLPPGVTGKLAGIPFCSEAGIAAAKARERTPHGGLEELDRPSCPQASEVGHLLVGAGVGNALTYVPGKVYLAGPYHGDSLSIVAITAAKAGPFDLGTVVVREGLEVNPETAAVFVDAAGSDPIPHIIDGIPVDLRDIRVYVNRPEFTLNPTNCQPTSTASTVLGSGTNFASEADDRPVTVTSRYQAADCASLGFKPKVALSLKGSPKRAGLPKLKAVVTPPAGDANIGKAVVTLPPSEFLEQGHIGTTCTRVQFNAGGGNGEQCPEKSIYGHAVAVTPLLSEPLEGPVFLRSNGGERQLPDLVAALHGSNINIDLVGYINSLHQKGSDISRIRNTFAKVPDAPVSRFTLEMFGGKKGLLVNSTNLCKGTHKAIVELGGQNGARYDTEPVVQAQCKKKDKGHKKAKGKAKSGDARSALAILGRGAW